jgi:hypothetical protein
MIAVILVILFIGVMVWINQHDIYNTEKPMNRSAIYRDSPAYDIYKDFNGPWPWETEMREKVNNR